MPNPSSSSFAALLRHHRVVAGFSQEALAEQAGLSVRAISDLERGIRRAPYHETVRVLADALKLSESARSAFEAAVTRSRGPLTAIHQDRVPRAPTLPVPVTPLIGRSDEVRELRARLRRGEERLITLVGPPGIGKTRLALAVAEGMVDDLPDGVVFVALAPIADAALVATTMLQALGVVDVGGPPPEDRLKGVLWDTSHLLVLDNFEQVVGAAPLISELLASCSDLSILVTSRVALRLRGEHEFAVSTLALPAPVTSSQGPEELQRLGGFPAIALFVDRVRAVRPGFVLTEENAPAVVEICRRLDGLPLAIELAAARGKVLAPQAMLMRLEHRLQLLTDGARDAPLRQRTLRAAIAWSHELLSSDERVLFRRLGVFVGGCTLATAERVCNASGDLDLDVLNGVSALVDQSLVQQRDGIDAESRFVMLETLREYALEQLELVGERHQLQRRHAADVLALTVEAEPHLFARERNWWLGRLSEEQDNIRSALRFTLEEGDPEIGLRIVGALWMWFLRRLLVEGRQWAESLLAHPGVRQETAARASCLFAAGHLAWLQGDVRVMRARLEESVAIRRRLADRAGLGRVLPFLGLAIDDDQATARSLAEEGVALCRDLRDEWGLAISLTNLGRIVATWGDDEAAALALEEATASFRAIGDGWLLALPLNSLGAIAYRQGNYERARAAFEEALPCFRAVEDRRNTTQVLTNLGFVTLAQGQVEQAHGLFSESLELGCEHGDRFNAPACLRGIAAAIEAQDPIRAARLLGAADALFAVTGATKWPAERLGHHVPSDSIRIRRGEPAFAAAWEAGRGLSLTQAVDDALVISPSRRTSR